MRLKAIPVLVIAGLFVISCGPYDKLLKSRDHVAKYEYALELYKLRKNNKAINLFESVAPIFSGTDKIDTIKFYTAKSYYRQGDFSMASLMLDEFRKTYTRSPFAEEAEYLYAMSHYEIAPGAELDQTHTHMAISAFTEYMERYSDSPKIETCQEIIDELTDRLYMKAYLVGKNYYDIGYYNSAVYEFENVLKNFPEITMRETVMYLIVKSNYQYARSSIEKKQRERFYNTIDASMSFINEYPESEYLADVEKMYANAQKLAKGQDIIDEVAVDLELTDKEVSRGTRKYAQIFDKVESGKLTVEEAKVLSMKLIEKSKRRSIRQGVTDHEADSIARREIEIEKLEDQALREQGVIPEYEKAKRLYDEDGEQAESTKRQKRSRKKDDKEAIKSDEALVEEN